MRSLKENAYWIWLSLIPVLGSIKKQKLLQYFATPEKIFLESKQGLLKIEGIGEKIVNEILDKNIRKSVKNHITYMEKNNIQFITIQDEEYPQILKEIYDYPISLYVKGNAEILNSKSIAIVGCRDATTYGKNSAKYFGYNLANEGICVVSGLAKGIDSYAHIGALGAIGSSDSKGKTIAVLGNGLDMIYPQENIELANMIIEKGGAIISEYPLGTKPDKMNFPARNRIVSGMSRGVLVVEAKEKSGTLITVDFALEQGRDVFVVPGNINSVYSVGTNRLIKEGARLVNCYEDLMEYI